jgi:hypothetical protein
MQQSESHTYNWEPDKKGTTTLMGHAGILLSQSKQACLAEQQQGHDGILSHSST